MLPPFSPFRKEMDNMDYKTRRMPILALRGLAIFPDQTVHFDIGRLKSALALEEAMRSDQILMLSVQKDVMVDDPGLSDLFPVGVGSCL